MNVKAMIETHPHKPVLTEKLLLNMIETAVVCEQSCVACADACLAEQEVQNLRKCIRLNLDCADICAATVRVFSRQTQGDLSVMRTQLEACAAVCTACGAECEHHAGHHRHCKVCTEACRTTEQAARKLLAEIGSR